MILSSSSVSQIRAKVAAIYNASAYKKSVPTRAIGIKTNSRWPDGENMKIGEIEFHVAQCDSTLQIREAFLNHQHLSEPLVVVTSLDESKLGQDVLARFVKRRLYAIQAWPILRDLFQARIEAPSLSNKKWLAEVLLADIPAQGYPAVPSGVLDEETIWRVILCERLGFNSARPDSRDLLEWSLSPQNIALYQSSSEQMQQGLQEWIIQSAGNAGDLIFNCIDNGQTTSAVAVGLACVVIFKEGGPAELREAAIRLERFTGNKPLGKTGATQWAEAAVSLIKQMVSRGEIKQASELLEQSDRLLSEIREESFAYLSDYSPMGYELRLERYGQLLQKALKNDKPSGLPELCQRASEISDHYQSSSSTERTKRVMMSLRLMHWLAQPRDSDPSSFAQASKAYVMNGGFIDWARQSISHGDSNKVLAQAYHKLHQKVTTRRELENSRFGQLLVNWTEMGSVGDGVLRIEDVLGKVVAKVAQHERALLLVMDGMSYAVFNELIEDISDKGWQPLSPINAEWPLPVIAALPSVTEASRASLLCGKLFTGPSANEVNGFKSNPDLLAISKSKMPPVLFHKGNLTVSGSSELTVEVRQEIESEKRRIVGAVVNAVDDHLAKGEQVAIPWYLKHLPILDHLLEAARDTGRIVILTSDHGHIIERETAYRKSESGERYRTDDGSPLEDELLVTGSRVLIPANQRIIAPWAENVRYGKKKHGYHGGISPQECIVPLAVLSRAHLKVEGWLAANLQRPAWWDVSILHPQQPSNQQVAFTRKKSDSKHSVTAEAAGTLPLFAATESDLGID